MSFIFRGIGNKAWWYKDRSDFPWLKEGKLVADVFKGLRTTHGALSMYAVNEKTDVNRIIAALACTRDSIQEFDYVLVPANTIKENFELNKTKGKTPDDTVNEWHLDIIHLTPSKLSDLVYTFRDHQESMNRLLKKNVNSEVRKRIDNGSIDVGRINEKLKEKFS